MLLAGCVSPCRGSGEVGQHDATARRGLARQYKVERGSGYFPYLTYEFVS